MNTFEWQLDRRFTLPDQTDLQVLQRTVRNVEVFELDLAPFYEEPAVWILRTTAQERTLGAGLLRRFSSQDDTDLFVVSFCDDREISLSVPNSSTRELTVWRYCKRLDMLQIRVVGNNSSIYGQLGGTETLAAFANLQVVHADHQDLRAAIGLYNTGRSSG